MNLRIELDRGAGRIVPAHGHLKPRVGTLVLRRAPFEPGVGLVRGRRRRHRRRGTAKGDRACESGKAPQQLQEYGRLV
jgi:hypothetical protein